MKTVLNNENWETSLGPYFLFYFLHLNHENNQIRLVDYFSYSFLY